MTFFLLLFVPITSQRGPKGRDLVATHRQLSVLYFDLSSREYKDDKMKQEESEVYSKAVIKRGNRAPYQQREKAAFYDLTAMGVSHADKGWDFSLSSASFDINLRPQSLSEFKNARKVE